MLAKLFYHIGLTIDDRGVEMDKDNSPSCEFSARAKDYHGWSNAEQPLVQGLAGAGRGWPASHLRERLSLICRNLITARLCPPATPSNPSNDSVSSLSFSFQWKVSASGLCSEEYSKLDNVQLCETQIKGMKLRI